jgi:hypothetical protein
MDERYPYIRFVIDAAQLIAGAVALVIVLGGTARACGAGGFGGFMGFLLTLLVAAVAYVGVMVRIESLKVFLDIEQSTQQTLATLQAPRSSDPPPPAGTNA